MSVSPSLRYSACVFQSCTSYLTLTLPYTLFSLFILQNSSTIHYQWCFFFFCFSSTSFMVELLPVRPHHTKVNFWHLLAAGLFTSLILLPISNIHDYVPERNSWARPWEVTCKYIQMHSVQVNSMTKTCGEHGNMGHGAIGHNPSPSLAPVKSMMCLANSK